MADHNPCFMYMARRARLRYGRFSAETPFETFDRPTIDLAPGAISDNIPINSSPLITWSDPDRYAIFDAYEVFILCGRNVLMPTGVPERITKEDILQK
ncbi:MAG: hypothetical protein JRI48_07070, partial [Deltaproteobacteria bacterium]|nr:hypothetical protein [Deltaproteobacteria bacterium]